MSSQLCSSFQLLVGDKARQISDGIALHRGLTGMIEAAGQCKQTAAGEGNEVPIVTCCQFQTMTVKR